MIMAEVEEAVVEVAGWELVEVGWGWGWRYHTQHGNASLGKNLRRSHETEDKCY